MDLTYEKERTTRGRRRLFELLRQQALTGIDEHQEIIRSTPELPSTNWTEADTFEFNFNTRDTVRTLYG